MNTTEHPVELTAADRCDCRACGAQAFVVAHLLAGDLYFCGHHYDAHALALIAADIPVSDFRDRINTAASVSGSPS